MQEAKIKVIQACKELVASGLIARTWGNVSCRIDETFFAITPSGRDYLSLKPEDIVVVKQKDLSYEGKIKPSSEKGVHGAIYEHRPWINFIVHTHQPMASTVSALGVEEMPVEKTDEKSLGKKVICADYGLPGSKKLKKGIISALEKDDGNAMIMAHHGALCMGADDQEAFAVASSLESACKAYLEKRYLKHSGNTVFDQAQMGDYFLKTFYQRTKNDGKIKKSLRIGSSCLKRSTMVLTMNTGEEYHMDLKTGDVLQGEKEKLPQVAYLHRDIYLHRPKVKVVSQCDQFHVMTLSKAAAKLKPQIDDFAQLLGTQVHCAKGQNIKEVEKALKGKNAVLIKDMGAVCIGENQEDVKACEMILQKAAMAFLYSHFFGNVNVIPWHECYLMRQNYLKNYSRMASKNKIL